MKTYSSIAVSCYALKSNESQPNINPRLTSIGQNPASYNASSNGGKGSHAVNADGDRVQTSRACTIHNQTFAAVY